MAETIHTVSIAQETRERYLRYAVSVIKARALPDVRDGLKPVHRRILYTMHHELHLSPAGRPAKCARIVGEVMGKYHPHGDQAIYDSLVRMAQPWMLREPLVSGQGNFGSVDGDAPAAYRYTEAKLAPAAERLLNELRQHTVEMTPTYDNATREPVVLPAEFPNLLVNGSSGIAVGMATNIPPHNLGETIRATIFLIDNPEMTTPELMQKLKGPDFPLGGKIVTDRATLRKIYETGRGSIKVQGEWKEEEAKGGRKQIVITSIPYGVDKGKLVETIGGIIVERKLPQATGIHDETNEKEGMRIVLEIKPGSDPNLVMAYLFKHTPLQDNFPYNITCLVPGPNNSTRPETLGVKAVLRHFLDFRLLTVTRRFEYELAQLRRRIHILEGFRIIFDALDEAIRIIRESKGKSDAAERLIARFELDAEQTDAILDAQLYKIASMEIKKILDELKEKKKQARAIEEILASEEKLWSVIKTEMTELAEQFPSRRRTRMASDEDVLEFDPEAYIARENTNVVLTRDGWVKRVGRLASVEGTRVREGDEVIAVVPGSTLDHVIFCADDGTAYTMRMNEVPASSGYGEPIGKHFKLADQVKILAAFTTDERFMLAKQSGESEEMPGPYLLAVTSAGYCLRTPLLAFRSASTKTGRRYVRLGTGEKVVFVAVPDPSVEGLMLASRNGRVLHCRTTDVNILAGAGKGVIGIKLDEKDECLGAALISDRHDALSVETTGGRTMELRRGAHPAVGRGGRGTEIVKRASLVRVIPSPVELPDWDAVEDSSKPVESKKKPSANGKSLFD